MLEDSLLLRRQRRRERCANCGKTIAAGNEKRLMGFTLGPRCFLIASGLLQDDKTHIRRIFKLMATAERQADATDP